MNLFSFYVKVVATIETSRSVINVRDAIIASSLQADLEGELSQLAGALNPPVSIVRFQWKLNVYQDGRDVTFYPKSVALVNTAREEAGLAEITDDYVDRALGHMRTLVGASPDIAKVLKFHTHRRTGSFDEVEP